MKTQYANLPSLLKKEGLFCLWQYEVRDGKKTKVPYCVRGYRADPGNKSTFSKFDQVISLANGYDGIGIGVFDDICAVDIDHCVEDGVLSEMADDIVKMMDSYTEYSPSGTGVRIFFKASGLSYDKERYYVNNRKFGLEIYVSGYTNKFVTATGNVLIDREVEDRTEALLFVLEKYMVKPTQLYTCCEDVPGSFLSDESVIAKASASKQGEKFSALWYGDASAYGSQSEADLALCSILAFWCGGDTEQMDRLFRQSDLMREKWEREDYRMNTLNRAVAMSKEFYKPLGRTAPAEDFNDISIFLEEATPERNDRYPWTDIGGGRLFADCFESIARYVPEKKSWYCYKDGVWSPDSGALRTMELCKALADALIVYAVSIHDERQRQEFMKYCTKWQMRRMRETLLKDAQGVHPISLSEFDCDPYAFNCKNGTLHLDTMEFTEHRAEDRLTKISNVAYDPNAYSSRFERFVSEIMTGDTDKARFLQKALGYGISGDTRYECMFIMYGATTRNGKGTLCESVLKVLGNYGCTARPETLSINANSNSQTPSEDIARLAGVRFANISEPGKGLLLNGAKVKNMTGNDTINARFLHEKSFDFAPQFKLYINTNYLPIINDMTLFSSGRVVIIPFERHFEEAEQDKTLKSEFSKPEVQSAILNWLVDGYRMLMKEGLSQPQAVKEATASYEHVSDKIAMFAEDNLIEDKRSEVRTAEVYSRYKEWCMDNGHRAESMKNFKQGLMTQGSVVRKRPRGGGSETTMLIGFKLVSDFL